MCIGDRTPVAHLSKEDRSPLSLRLYSMGCSYRGDVVIVSL